jgi:lysine-N-methylase
MQTFRCTGSDCEDTCCRHWGIDIDQGHFVKLKRLLERAPGGKERFERTFQLRDVEHRSRQTFARVIFDERGVCPFLDDQKLCQLHATHGEDALPDICAAYPRVVSIAGERLELTGELSCPEAARGCLLAEDGTELVDIEPYAGRPLYHHELSKHQNHPYRAFIDQVRGTFYRLMGDGGFSIASRLFFASCLAERTLDHFDETGERFDEERLRSDLEQFSEPALLETLHRELRANPGNGAHAISIVGQLLAVQVVTSKTSPRFQELVKLVLSGYAQRGEGARQVQDGDVLISPEPLWEAYRARRERLKAAVGDRLERYFENYAKHYFIRYWYTDSKNLFVHVQTLLLRLAVLKFLLVSHPLLDGIEQLGEAERAAAADRAVVDAVYSFSRHLEHFPLFLEKLNVVVAAQLGSLGASAALLTI